MFIFSFPGETVRPPSVTPLIARNLNLICKMLTLPLPGKFLRTPMSLADKGGCACEGMADKTTKVNVFDLPLCVSVAFH